MAGTFFEAENQRKRLLPSSEVASKDAPFAQQQRPHEEQGVGSGSVGRSKVDLGPPQLM